MSNLTQGMILESGAHAYRLERELGKGGFGVTWLAHRVADAQPVALKQLHVQRGADPKSLELFKREIATLRQLDHPRIPDYLDDFMHDGLVLVQEFVEGHDLSGVVRGERSMDEGQLVSCLAQVLEILVYLHGRTPPVIHRDITPRNILLKPDGTVYLVDFGAVKLGIAGSMASTSTGTFGYAPMEQFVSQAFPASDLYGLGMTAVAVAAGKAPVDMTFSRMRVDIRGITRLDPRLARLLERMTEPDPERRLGDARVALEQLRPLVVRAASAHGAALKHLALEQSTTTRGWRPDADLLPSERLREAGLRLATLDTPWKVPDFDRVDDVDGVAISPDGSVIVVDSTIIDAGRMTRLGRLDAGMHPVAVGVAGAAIVARGDEHDSTLTVFRRAGDAWQRSASLATGAAKAVALSPDGRTAAVITGFFADREGELLLFDIDSGQLNQRVDGTFETVTFSTDGGTIAAIDDDRRLHLLSASGATERIPDCSAVAYGPDGRTIALVRDGTLTIGPVTSPGAGRINVRLGSYSMRCPAFSPDGRWFAVFNYSEDRIEVVDLEAGKALRPIRNPGRPTERIGSPAALGFSADGERLFVGCDLHFSRYSGEDEDCLGVWRLPDRAWLGALLGQGERGAAVAVSAEGFYGRIEADRDEGGWRRPTVARRLLCGAPVAELIDAPSRAALADLQTRWAAVEQLIKRKALDAKAPVGAMLDALSGLTHVIDLVVERARRSQAQRPTFGGGARGPVALTGDQLRQAAAHFAALSTDELAALHADLVAVTEAKEAERAKGVDAAQAKAMAAYADEERAAASAAKRGAKGASRAPRKASKALARREADAMPAKALNRTLLFVGGGVGLLIAILTALL